MFHFSLPTEGVRLGLRLCLRIWRRVIALWRWFLFLLPAALAAQLRALALQLRALTTQLLARALAPQLRALTTQLLARTTARNRIRVGNFIGRQSRRPLRALTTRNLLRFLVSCLVRRQVLPRYLVQRLLGQRDRALHLPLGVHTPAAIDEAPATSQIGCGREQLPELLDVLGLQTQTTSGSASCDWSG